MSNENKIKVIMIEPLKEARVAEIDASLEGLQKAVGGYIEAYYGLDDPDCCIVCNEEGKMNGMRLNRAIYDDNKQMIEIIAGPAFICDCSGENFGSLNKEQLDKYKQQFRYPEHFVRMGNEIKAIPFKPERDRER